MAQYIEDWLPDIREAGLNTQEAVSLGSTLSVTGASTLTGATTVTGALTATAGVTSPVGFTALNASASTSGGVTTAALTMGTGLFGIYFGSGAPTVTAPQGSLYLRVDGSTTLTRLYVNTNAATSWTAAITVV